MSFDDPGQDVCEIAACTSVCFLAQTGGSRTGRARPLCPGTSDINSFRYCEGVIDLDAEDHSDKEKFCSDLNRAES
jgi:hypothetical protein